jgi:hypothetical protein
MTQFDFNNKTFLLVQAGLRYTWDKYRSKKNPFRNTQNGFVK